MEKISRVEKALKRINDRNVRKSEILKKINDLKSEEDLMTNIYDSYVETLEKEIRNIDFENELDREIIEEARV